MHALVQQEKMKLLANHFKVVFFFLSQVAKDKYHMISPMSRTT